MSEQFQMKAVSLLALVKPVMEFERQVPYFFDEEMQGKLHPLGRVPFVQHLKPISLAILLKGQFKLYIVLRLSSLCLKFLAG